MSERLDRRRLVAQIQAGDRQVFKELYLRYFDRVNAYLSLMLEDEAEANAATQTAFRMALSELPAYRFENGSFEGWLCRFVRRAGRRQVVGGDAPKAREEGRPASSQGAAAGAAEPELDLTTISDGVILRMIPRLPRSERELVILRYMFGLSLEELSAVVERSADEVGTRHQQALASLTVMLAGPGELRASCSSGAPARPS